MKHNLSKGQADLLDAIAANERAIEQQRRVSTLSFNELMMELMK